MVLVAVASGAASVTATECLELVPPFPWARNQKVSRFTAVLLLAEIASLAFAVPPLQVTVNVPEPPKVHLVVLGASVRHEPLHTWLCGFGSGRELGGCLAGTGSCHEANYNSARGEPFEEELQALLAQSAIDRLKSAAYGLVLEGESYRSHEKPGLPVGTTTPRPRRRRRF